VAVVQANHHAEYEACVAEQLQSKAIENHGETICTIEKILDYYINGVYHPESEAFKEGEACYVTNGGAFGIANEFCNLELIFVEFVNGGETLHPFNDLNVMQLECIKNYALAEGLVEYRVEITADFPSNETCQDVLQVLKDEFMNEFSACEIEVMKKFDAFDFVLKMRVLGELQLTKEQKEREFGTFHSTMIAINRAIDACE